jgi:hypothetical protein
MLVQQTYGPVCAAEFLTLSYNFRWLIKVKLIWLNVPYRIILLLFVPDVKGDSDPNNDGDDRENHNEEPLIFQALASELIGVSGADF